MLERTFVRGVALAFGCALAMTAAAAETAAVTETDPGKSADGAAPAQTAPNWASSCAGPDRAGPFDCAVEQRVIIKETGQQLARIVIKVSGTEPHNSALLVQLPLGISLRAGVKLSVDGKQFSNLDVQTCDNTGCYAGAAAPVALIDAMKQGKALGLNFQNLQQKPIDVNFVLAGFKTAYSKVE